MPVPVAELSPMMSGRMLMVLKPGRPPPPLRATDALKMLATPAPGVEPRLVPRIR